MAKANFVRRALRQVRDKFPFTPLGLVLLAGAAAATINWGFAKMDLVVLAMGAAALGIGAICLVTVVLTSIVLRQKLVKAHGEGLALECGTPTRTGFSMSTLWYVPLVVVKWKWKDPEASLELVKQRGRKVEIVTAHRRGVYDGVVRRIEVTDAFHLTKIAFEVRESRKIRALPASGLLKQMRVIRSMASGEDHPDPTGLAGGDRSDIRNYVAGDPIRFILWRVFAKSRQMVVRTPERAVSIARKAYAYLVAGDGDEPAAGAARVAIESGILGTDWVFGADGVDEHADRRVQALEVLAQSARARPDQSGAGLGKFLQRHASGGGRIVVFVPARPGPWLQRIVTSAPKGVEFIVCTDGIVAKTKKTWLLRVATVDEKKLAEAELEREVDKDGTPERAWATADADEVDLVMKTLGATRARVVLADRRAGRIYEGNALPIAQAKAKAAKAKAAAEAQHA